MESTATSNITVNIQDEDELFKLACSLRLPPRLKPITKKTHHAKKQLPFEAIDLSMYEDDDTDTDYANMVAFRVERDRICGWAYSVLKYHCLTNQKDCSYEVKLLSNSGLTVSADSAELSKLQVHVVEKGQHAVTLHIYFTNGTVSIQGKKYKQWADAAFPVILETVNDISKTITKRRKEIKEVPAKPEADSKCEKTSSADSNPNKPHDSTKTLSTDPAKTVTRDSNLPEHSTNGIGTHSLTLTEAAGGVNLDVGNPEIIAPKVDTVSQDEPPSNNSSKSGSIITSTPNKDKFLSQAQKLRTKSDSQLSKLDATVVDLVDKVSKVENDSTERYDKLSKQLSDIYTLLQTVHSKQVDLEAQFGDDLSAIKKKQLKCSLSEKISKKVSEVYETSTTSKELLEAVKKQGEENSSEISKLKDAQSKTDDEVRKLQTNILTITQDTNKIQTNIAKLIAAPDGAEAKKPTEQQEEGKDEEDKFKNVKNGVPRPNRDLPPIKDNIKTVMLSDSIMQKMTPEMLGPSSQIVALGEGTTAEMTEILNNAPQNQNINNAILHAGYKDCKGGLFDSSDNTETKNMIKAAKKAFPKANVALTSVLPSKTNKNRVNIDIYNSVIKSSCETLGVQYIDLTAMVTSANGKKPNQKLYRDDIHMNEKGAQVVAEHLSKVIQYPEESDSESETDSNDGDDEEVNEPGQLFHSLRVFEEEGNAFVAHIAKVNNRQEVREIQTAINAKFSDATSNSFAYRFKEGPRKIVQESVDDGEYLAGQVMLNCLQDYKVPNTLVAISRWVGTHLENRRFEIYYNLTAVATGHDPAKNLPWPNRHPKFNPPLPSRPRTRTTQQSKPPGFSQLNPGPYFPSMQNKPPFSGYGNQYQGYQNNRSYRAHNNYTGSYGYYGPRYTYIDGERSMAQI